MYVWWNTEFSSHITLNSVHVDSSVEHYWFIFLAWAPTYLPIVGYYCTCPLYSVNNFLKVKTNIYNNSVHFLLLILQQKKMSNMYSAIINLYNVNSSVNNIVFLNHVFYHKNRWPPLPSVLLSWSRYLSKCSSMMRCMLTVRCLIRSLYHPWTTVQIRLLKWQAWLEDSKTHSLG